MPATRTCCQNSLTGVSSLERQRLPAREPLFEPVPVGDALLAVVPAEEHELAVFRVTGRKVDETPVEVLHLYPGGLELGHEPSHLARGFLDGALCLLELGGLEPASVPGHAAAKRTQPAARRKEPPSCGDEPLDERRDDGERGVRFLLGEEAHRW